MRVLLTGATGFIGSFVLRRLLSCGSHDVALLAPPGSETWRIDDYLGPCERIDGDLEDLRPAEASILDFAPEVVVHLAWSGVAARLRDDACQLANLRGSLDLVQIALRAGARAWVGLGSQAEYGPWTGPIREDAPTRPTSLYGAAKLSCGLLAGRLCAEAGVRFAWLRLFSAYGPTDDPNRFVPHLIRTLLESRRPSLTEGVQLWDYLAAEDAAEAIGLAAVDSEAEGIYNLGSGDAVPLRQVAEMIRDLIDPAAPLGLGEVPYGHSPVMHLQADVSRLRDELGWSPRIPLEKGLAELVAWSRGLPRRPATAPTPAGARPGRPDTRGA